ncbi:MAG: hypothetical protein DRP58_05820 [Spirochaetes bacterium]|nr:MAG: hypothetical protein DRP58_05820 [Spirochaetota bacterium]
MSRIIKRFSFYSIFSLCILLSIISCTKKVDNAALSRYLSAKKEYENQNLNTALLEFTALNKDYSKFYQSRFMEGKTLYFLKKFDKAALVFADLLEDNPAFSQGKLWMARVLTASGAYDMAETTLLEQLALDPTDPRILFDLSKIKARQGNSAGSFEYLQKAKLFSEEFVHVYINLAKFYYQNDITDRALEELNTALQLLDKKHPLVFAINNLKKEIQFHE